jgi:hypothetical protein
MLPLPLFRSQSPSLRHQALALLRPWFFLIALLASSAAHAQPRGERSYAIEDPFGIDHGTQAVRFVQEFTAPGPALNTLAATVNNQRAFFQTRALATHPDGSVKTGEWVLWLHLATPNPRSKETPAAGSAPKFDVKLVWGMGAASSAPFPGTPVTVTRQGDYFLINTGPARFLVPNNKLIPSASGRGPQGPIAGFSAADDPVFYGGHAHVEGADLRSILTEPTERGPATLGLAVTYTDVSGLTWRSELTFTAGSPVVQIDERMDLSATWVIDLSPDLAPDTQFANPWFDWESSNQRGNPSEKPLRAWKREAIRGGEWPDLNEFFRLDPKWHDYQYMKGPWAWYYNKADRAQKRTAIGIYAWNMSRWHPTYQSRPRVIVDGDAKGRLRIRVPITGGPHNRTLESDGPASPVARVVRTTTASRSWGIGAHPTPEIVPASETRADALAELQASREKTVAGEVKKERSALEKRARDEFAKANSPTTPEAIQSRIRQLGWPAKTDEAIVADRLRENPNPPPGEVDRRASQLASSRSTPVGNIAVRTLVQNAHLPVTKIKDWIFTWPDMDNNVDRGIFRGLDDLVALQADIKAGRSPLARGVNAYIAEMEKTLVKSTDSKGNPVESVDRKYGKDWEVARRLRSAEASSALVFEFATRGGGFRPDPRWIYHNGYTAGGLNPTTAPRGVRATIWTNSYNNLWRKTGLTAQNRSMVAMAYIFADPDFWNGRYYDWGIGNPNFHTDMHNIPGMIAAQLNTHPHAKRWADYSSREIYADIARSSWQPGGGWTESPGYTSHVFSVFLPSAHAFQRAGFVDVFANPNFSAAIGFIENLITPFDARISSRGQVAIGDSQGEMRTEVIRQAALGYAKTQPPRAAALMAAARSAETFSGIKPGELSTTLLTTDPSLPPAPDWKLHSRYYGGIGAFLRSRFGEREHESLVTFKAGPARNHYQGDELAFTFWGAGAYLALDYASFYNPRMNPDWTHNKVTFGITASSPVAKVMAFAAHEAGDLVVADNVNDSLQIMTQPYASQRALWDYPSLRTAPKTNRRLALLVKHPADSPIADYLVVRDELSGQLDDTFPPAQLEPRLRLVFTENLEAYIRDASYAPSQAPALFTELERHLRLLGANPDTAAKLTAAARQAASTRRTSPPKLERDFPDLLAQLDAALKDGSIRFDHAPRSNLHLLVHDNPKRSPDRLDFKGQLGVDLTLYVATGQDASTADINDFGWGNSTRPPDFPPFDEPRSARPWMGGQWHSHRHGPVIGRDVRLPGDTSSKLPEYKFGEQAQWVSLPFAGKRDLAFMLYPVRPGQPSPDFSASENGKVITVTVAGRSETIHLASDRPVKIVRDGTEHIIQATLPAVGAPQPAELVVIRNSDAPADKPNDNPASPADTEEVDI